MRCFIWVGERPWIMQSVMGLVWIFMALVSLGKDETYGIFVSFFGMLVWASLEKDNQDLQHDIRRALAALREMVNYQEREP